MFELVQRVGEPEPCVRAMRECFRELVRRVPAGEELVTADHGRHAVVEDFEMVTRLERALVQQRVGVGDAR